jgi:hypothetical protein
MTDNVLVAVLSDRAGAIRGVLHWFANGRLCGSLRGLPPRVPCSLALADRDARVVRPLATILADGDSVVVNVAAMCNLSDVVGCSLLVLPTQSQHRALCDGVLGWTQAVPLAKM